MPCSRPRVTLPPSQTKKTRMARDAAGFEFDVVVVGASFAGAACAIAAARRGLRVCVLERKRDPGDKLRTTGIIVKEAAEQTLLQHLPAAMTRRIESVRLYAPSLKQVALAAPGYYFLTTDTPAVMRWLAGQLRRYGAELRLGCAFTDAGRIDGGWEVAGVGRTRYLVGADGARSRVARRCGLGEVRQFLYGIEYEFPGARLADAGALHCFIASVMRRATSAGWRRTPAACRPGWRCATTPRRRGCRTSTASCCGWASPAACRATCARATRAPG